MLLFFIAHSKRAFSFKASTGGTLVKRVHSRVSKGHMIRSCHQQFKHRLFPILYNTEYKIELNISATLSFLFAQHPMYV